MCRKARQSMVALFWRRAGHAAAAKNIPGAHGSDFPTEAARAPSSLWHLALKQRWKHNIPAIRGCHELLIIICVGQFGQKWADQIVPAALASLGADSRVHSGCFTQNSGRIMLS